MSAWEKVACPKCAGNNIGRSHWRSRDEKRSNPGRHPARCQDCGHRFLASVRHDIYGIVIALLVAAVGLFVLLGVFGGNRPPPESEPAQGISLTITPAAMKAAEAGDAEAQFSVATSMLADAELNLAYSTKAVEFLTRAAEQGHARAMLRLGVLHRQGVGALQNFGLAAKWIENAARLGEPEAMLELGRLYREGVGVGKDPVKAYVWLNRAAAARDLQAIRERAEVARLLTESELKKAQEESAVDLPAGDRAAQPAAAVAPNAPPATAAGR